VFLFDSQCILLKHQFVAIRPRSWISKINRSNGVCVCFYSGCHALVTVRQNRGTCDYQWCGPRPSVLGQDRSETKNRSWSWSCTLCSWSSSWSWSRRSGVLLRNTYGLVTLVVIMILKDTATFQVLFVVSLFCAWNITSVEINSGFAYLKLNPPSAFVFFRWSWSWSASRCFVTYTTVRPWSPLPMCNT